MTAFPGKRVLPSPAINALNPEVSIELKLLAKLIGGHCEVSF